MCHNVCGGLIGVMCLSNYFCDYQLASPPPSTVECAGNYDQVGVCIRIPTSCTGAFGGQVCGCASHASTPTDYANDCQRRTDSASTSHNGPCN